MPEKPFSTGDALRFGWETFKQNVGFFLLLLLTFFILNGIPNWLAQATVENMPNLATSFSLLGWLVSLILNMGVIYISLSFVDGKTPELVDLFTPYKLFFTFFAAGLLYALIVLFGFILLIIPGIIFWIMFFFHTYRIIDEELSFNEIPDALKYSKHITAGVKGRIFLFFLALAGVNLLGLLAFGVGLFITIPVTWVATAHAYRQLEDSTVETAEEVREPKSAADDEAEAEASDVDA